MASLLSRRTATTRLAASCYARRHHLYHHGMQKIGVAICNFASQKFDQIISTSSTDPQQQNRWLSTTLQDSDSDSDGDESRSCIQKSSDSIQQYANHPCFPRLRSLRNVGVFAHVDAGKTTVTERMLALSGIVQNAGSVDDGDTVTDYLPAERERGIVSAAYNITYFE